MRRRLLVLVGVLSLAGVLTLAAAGPASASVTRRSEVHYNGAASSLNFVQSGTTLTGIWAGLQLGATWANSYCAYAKLLRNGYLVSTAARQCDTDGDAHLRFTFPSTTCRPGQTMSVWFSDPMTRYSVMHPAIIC